MSEDNNQDLKEIEPKPEETLNLTGKELEEYKTYLKFKNEIEKQNESQKDVEVKSQNITQNQSQSQDNKSSEKSTTKSFERGNGITDMNDPDYTFDEESIKEIGYKEFFMEPIDIGPIEAYRNKRIISLILLIVCCNTFYGSTIGYNNTVWIIFKILVGVYAGRKIFYTTKQLIVTEPINSIKPKIYSYNALIRDAEWVKLSNTGLKYENIAEYTIKSKLRLVEGIPRFRRDKYTEVYHKLNSDLYVVYGIYDSIGFISTRYLGYMIVIENEECVLNLVAGVVLRKKLIILDDI